MRIASSNPTPMPNGNVTHCMPQIRLRPKITAADNTTAPIISGSSSLSSRRCIWNASKICRRRARAWARFSCDACFLAALSSAGFFSAMLVRIRPRGPSPCQQGCRLLGRGPLLGQMPQRLGKGFSPPQDGLRVQPAGPVGGANERSVHDPGKADLLGGAGVGDELLRLDPSVDRVMAQRRAQVLGDGEDL